MSDPSHPGDLPPDLPPEYAEAYRRAYERAYRDAAGRSGDREQGTYEPDTYEEDTYEPDDHEPGPESAPEPYQDAEPTRTLHLPDPGEHDHGRPTSSGWHPEEPAEGPRVSGPLFADEPTQQTQQTERTDTEGTDEHQGLADDVLSLGEHEGEEYDEPERDRARPTWLVPALLAGAVVVLLLAAYGIGRALSGSVDDGAPSAESDSSLTHPPEGEKYDGPLSPVEVGSASASCESPAGVDAAGNPVKYKPGNAVDGDLTTAWRCNGNGKGETLTLDFNGPVKVGSVGLVPGYAKTDPRTGEDRYKQNNRITKVRWVFSDGTAVEQAFDPSPDKRRPQRMRIPVTEADSVDIEILDSKRGPRNTIAISEVRIGEAVD